nr:MAG TPA: hypothetical protein [Caudoviricetes sp.]
MNRLRIFFKDFHCVSVITPGRIIIRLARLIE